MAGGLKIIDGRMHERMSMVGGLLGLMVLAAIAVYVLVYSVVSSILHIVPKS